MIGDIMLECTSLGIEFRIGFKIRLNTNGITISAMKIVKIVMILFVRFIIESSFLMKLEFFGENKKCANRSQRTEKRKLQLSPNKLNRILCHADKVYENRAYVFTKSKKVHLAYYTMHKNYSICLAKSVYHNFLYL